MFDEIKNRFDYSIRNLTKFSRKNYSEDLSLTESLNNYTFDILAQCFEIEKESEISVLDIGSKNWAYVRGEHKFFKQFADLLYLDGVEIDAYRLYSNLFSRYEVAKFYTKDLPNTCYYPDNLLNINKKYDYITWFLPFITKYPLQKWGLPEKFFMPEKLLLHAYNILEKQMLIVNQGKEEALIQKELLEKFNIPYKELGLVKSSELEYKNERYAFLIVKNSNRQNIK